jgi:hypothetical protein
MIALVKTSFLKLKLLSNYLGSIYNDSLEVKWFDDSMYR